MFKGAINKLGQYMSETFDFNKATLSGCIDIIVVEQPDGSLKSSSFHVRFGKFKVLKTKERQVTIHINGQQQVFNMKLEPSGQAYFEEYREQKDLRKFSEDINPSESDYDIQSPSEDEDMLVSPQSETNLSEQFDAQQLEKNQEKELQKMEKMFNQTSLSPKSNKGIMDSLIKMFKSKKNLQEESAKKDPNGAVEQQQQESPKKNQNQENSENNNSKKSSNDISQSTDFSLAVQVQEQEQMKLNTGNKKELTIDPKNYQQYSCEDLDRLQVDQQVQQQINSVQDGLVLQQQEQVDQQGYQQEQEEEEEEDEYDEDIIELSLCSHLINKQNEDDPSEIFEQNKVPFEKFIQDPIKILQNKNLLIRIKDELYTYELAVSILICQQAFKQELPYESKKKMLKKKEGFFSKLFSNKKSPLLQPQQPSQIQQQQVNSDQGLQQQQNVNIPLEQQQQQIGSSQQLEQVDSQSEQLSTQASAKKQILKKTLSQDIESQLDNSSVQYQQQRSHRKLSEDSITSDQSLGKKRKIKKSFRPKSQVLESFDLKPGRNIISFSVKTELQGEQTVQGSIFLFKKNTQIVISDIDGTITKSDVLGQLMPMVGKEWSHEGIVDLYNSINKNGYEILYLTARAIGQSMQTRNFIESLEQDGVKLPQGPIVMSPDRLFNSFKREVIHKKPEVFKIVALRDIQGLFQSPTPFYAGFGNKETDAIAYKAVGVSMGRIFIINPNGQIFQFNNTYNKTYSELNEMSDDMFPAIQSDEEKIEDKYNNANYWGNINQYASVDIDALLNE